MYRDVKKKLLSVALCICMVIGAVQIVPKAQAAANVSGNTVTVTGLDSDGKSTDYTLTVDRLTFSYNGDVQMPTIRSVVANGKNIDISGWQFNLVQGDDGKTVKTHACYLTATGYTFTESATQFNYDITKATISQIQIANADTVVWKSGGTTPVINSVRVNTGDGDWITLDSTQYTVGSVTGTGTKRSTLTVTDDTNFDLSVIKSKDIEYNVAYSLAGKLSDGTTENEMYISNATVDYTGNVQTPSICLKDSSDSTVDVTTQTNFIVRYYKGESAVSQIINAGTYTIKVSAKNNYALVNGNYYTDTYTGTFTVRAGATKGLRVVASDEKQNDASVVVYENGAQTRTLIYSYQSGKAVPLRNVHVYDGNDDVTDYFTPVYNPTDPVVGTALLTLRPKEDSNYSGNIQINYFITSKLAIKSMTFQGKDPGDYSNLVYTGQPVVPLSIEVVNANGGLVNSGYTITYKYVENGVELEAAGSTDSHLATPGVKKVVITGTGNYADAGSIEASYTVLAVNMESEQYKKDFTLTLKGLKTSGDRYYEYYKGSAWEPETELIYKKGTANEKELVLGTDYTVTYEKNIEIGSASVTVTAVSGSNYEGSRSVQFSIYPLDLQKAKIASDSNTVVYTGKGIKPAIKLVADGLYEYELQNKDFDVVQYAQKDGTILDAAPIDVGEYKITIKNINTNISGDTVTLAYEIVPKDIADVGFLLTGVNGDNREIEWNGEKTEPQIESALIPTKDYTYKYNDSDKVSTVSGASVVITGQGNYTGTKTLYYTITRRSFTTGDKSDFTITSSYSGNVTDADGYKIKLSVKDAARSPESAQALHMGTDYTVQTVEYYDDLTKTWETLAASAYDATANDTVKNLKKAGRYRITIAGDGSYQGTLQTEQACGTDLSTYYVGINELGTTISYPYTGSTVTPSAFILYTSAGNKTSIADDCYTIDYERTDTYSEKLIDIGTIYVIGVGVPEKGYYGRTQIKADNKKGYYTITAPKWVAGTYTLEVSPSSIKFAPNGGTSIPTITLTFNGKKLVEGSDYELVYDDEQVRTAGSKQITVRGINNYADRTNVKYANYVVSPVAITEAEKEDHGDASYNGGRPDFTLTYEEYTLVEGVDYKKDVKQDPTTGAEIIKESDNKYYITYEVTGKGNFSGTREIKIPISVSGLNESDASFADSKDTAQVGQYYVVWKDDECVIPSDQAGLRESERTAVTPAGFSIVYKKSATETTTLRRGASESDPKADYIITGYGENVTPGVSDANYVVIQGINGYSGVRQLKFKLFTDISGAKTTSTSLIRNDSGSSTPTIITKQKWQQVYKQEGERGLVELANLSFDETEGIINTDEYTLRWSKGFNIADPAVGTATLTIVGAQQESHYYSKSFDIDFTIVNGLEDADISVNGDSNSIQYKGTPAVVTESGISFVVKVDNVTLKRGTDYEIKGYENNDRIGEATVRIEGKGNYAGEAEHQFKITYPLSQLVVYMENEEGRYVNTAVEQVRYAYKAKDITPRIHVYCPLDLPSSTDDYNSITPLSEASYTVEYENNRNAGTASVVIKDAQYFTGDTQRKVPFVIGVASICPPTKGAISYTTSMGTSVDNIRITYAAKSFSASDLGIELLDKGTPLVSGNSGDYVIYYTGDTRNVSKPTALPGVTFVGVNNYTDSHSITFTIDPKSLSDSDIVANNAQPVTLVYSGADISEEVKDKLNVIFTGAEKLVCDTDYTIEGYYTDSLCLRKVLDSDAKPVAPSAQGEYFAKLVGIGNYEGEKIVQINVGKKDMSSGLKISFIATDDCPLDAAGEPVCVYNGVEHKPQIRVTYGDGVTLVENQDYSVTYADNLNASNGSTQASVTVTALPNSNYDGSVTRTFTIQPKNIAQLDTSANTMYYSPLNESYPFTGSSVEPAMTIRDSETNATLENPTDYTIDYTSEYKGQEIADGAPEHSYGGLVTMTITGQGNYTGTQEFTYYIGEDISRARALVNGNRSVSTTYNGLAQAPAENTITVEKDSTMTNLTDENYDIAYYKNGFDKTDMVTRDQIIDAATYYIAVIGVPSKGTYAKTSEQNSCAYTIYPRSVAPSYVLVSGYDGSYYYTGQPIEPKGITVEDTDLPVVNEPNDPQRRSVKLVNGTDYDISYVNNRSAGKASIIVTGKGNYTGSRAAYFNIVSSSVDGNNTWDGTSEGTGSITNGSTTISASDIILGYDNTTYNCMMYNGYERVPTVSINGMSNSDFIVTASNAIRPGVATLVIDGINNYQGRIYKNYTIKADLSQYGTVSTIADQSYTGYQITPYVTLTCGGNLLTVGNDYTVTYANNTNVGRATVIATATANSYYVGTANGYFNISNTATGMEITGYASTYTYTGNAITPDVVVTMNGRMLNRGTDYTVTYSNNTNVGTATMTVTGIGSFSGTKTINYTIEAKNIENCITTAVTNYQYTGNTYTPSVTLTDSSTGKTLTAGTDYTITYSNNTNPGTASITVTALSRNYTGSKVISFKITSAAVSGLRASQIKNNSLKLSWSDQDYAGGYQICNANNRVIGTTSNNSYTVKGLTSCTTYRYKVRSYVENADGSVSYGSFSTAISAKTMLNTPTLKARSTSRGKVTLTWSKVAKATGYEIYYSTEKNGIYTKLKTVSKSSARRYIDSGLASGEKYYYTIRAYRTVNGVKTYSSYNTIKSATVR